MNRRQLAITTLALSALAFAPTSACKKDKSGGNGVSGGSADMLGSMPKDSAAVIGISWSKARDSALFKKYEEKLMTGDAADEAAEMKEKCGIDMMADLKTIILAPGKSMQDDEKDVTVAVKGNFDKAKVEACITKMGGTVADGVYTKDGKPINVYWPSADTIVLSPKYSVEQLKAFASASVKDNAELMALIGKVDSGATIWAAGMVPPELGAMTGGMAKAPTGAYLTLNINSGINATLGGVFESEDDAKGAAGALNMVLPMAKQQAAGMLDDISSEQSGKSIILKAKISGEQINKLVSMTGGMGF